MVRSADPHFAILNLHYNKKEFVKARQAAIDIIARMPIDDSEKSTHVRRQQMQI